MNFIHSVFQVLGLFIGYLCRVLVVLLQIGVFALAASGVLLVFIAFTLLRLVPERRVVHLVMVPRA